MDIVAAAEDIAVEDIAAVDAAAMKKIAVVVDIAGQIVAGIALSQAGPSAAAG